MGSGAVKPARARTDIQTINDDLQANLAYFREKFSRAKNPEADRRWAEIETFCAVAIRVMAKTNPSKIRDTARTLEIAVRIHGGDVIED